MYIPPQQSRNSVPNYAFETGLRNTFLYDKLGEISTVSNN